MFCLLLLRIWVIFVRSLALKYFKKCQEIWGGSRTVWCRSQWVNFFSSLPCSCSARTSCASFLTCITFWAVTSRIYSTKLLHVKSISFPAETLTVIYVRLKVLETSIAVSPESIDPFAAFLPRGLHASMTRYSRTRRRLYLGKTKDGIHPAVAAF